MVGKFRSNFWIKTFWKNGKSCRICIEYRKENGILTIALQRSTTITMTTTTTMKFFFRRRIKINIPFCGEKNNIFLSSSSPIFLFEDLKTLSCQRLFYYTLNFLRLTNKQSQRNKSWLNSFNKTCIRSFLFKTRETHFALAARESQFLWNEIYIKLKHQNKQTNKNRPTSLVWMCMFKTLI